MLLEFIGAGEAFEPQLGNASVLVQQDSRILVDCGYGVPAKLFERGFTCSELDAVCISHFHADHCFGVPAVLGRAWEEGRTKPMTFIGQTGLESLVIKLMDLAYPGMRSKFAYEVRFIEAQPGQAVRFHEFQIDVAESLHAVKNFAFRFTCDRAIAAISGDGSLTEASRALYAPCSALVHEAFQLNEAAPVHGCAREVIAAADELPQLRDLVFTHLQREARKTQSEAFLQLGFNKCYRVHIASPGTVIRVQ